MIGYGAGNFLPGLLIQQQKVNSVAEIEALCWGWRLMLLWAGWGIIFLILALRSTMKNQKVDLQTTLPLSEVVVLVDRKPQIRYSYLRNRWHVRFRSSTIAGLCYRVRSVGTQYTITVLVCTLRSQPTIVNST